MRLFAALTGLASVFANVVPEPKNLYDITHIVKFDIEIGGESLGTIEIGLFGENVPLTVDNYCKLANGYKFPNSDREEGFAGYA